MEIRRVRPEEYAALSRITVSAYRQLFGGGPLGPYEAQLVDVARRAEDSEVYVALGEDNSVLGGVTYVPGSDRVMSEFSDANAAGIRMLAVDPHYQGAGVGRALAEACVQRARADGRQRLILHSTPVMTAAHHIYEQLGFVRSPELDEWIDENPGADHPLHLMAFGLELFPE
ncbi:MAG: GNAT family N-acetyltransferase [Acidimicrobiales bacterium]